MANCFLTIDSGGSKTKLSLFTTDQTKLKETAIKGYGLAIDSDVVIDSFCTDLVSFCDGFDVKLVVCNLGGKNKNQFFNTIKKAFPNAKIELFRESEGVVALTLCKKYCSEVTLMVGTGSIAVAPNGENTVILGGWGANVSDKGSGYQLGLDAIKLALEEIDGVKKCSLLTKTLTGVEFPPKDLSAVKYCEFRDRVRQKLLPFDRQNIASFAKTVSLCAKNGDKKSLSILKKVGKDLADIVIATARKVGGVTNLVVTGGMVNSKEFWQEQFERRIKAKYNLKKVYYISDGVDVATKEIAKNIL